MTISNQEHIARASFTMWPFWNFDTSEHNFPYNEATKKVMIFGGWADSKNYNVCLQYDMDENHVCLIHKHSKIEKDAEGNDIEKPEYLYLMSADKVVRQPVQVDKSLIVLGRNHIHIIDIDEFKFLCFKGFGEASAETQGILHTQLPKDADLSSSDDDADR